MYHTYCHSVEINFCQMDKKKYRRLNWLTRNLKRVMNNTYIRVIINIYSLINTSLLLVKQKFTLLTVCIKDGYK